MIVALRFAGLPGIYVNSNSQFGCTFSCLFFEIELCASFAIS